MMIMIFYLYLEMIDGNDDMNEKHFINDRFLQQVYYYAYMTGYKPNKNINQLPSPFSARVILNYDKTNLNTRCSVKYIPMLPPEINPDVTNNKIVGNKLGPDLARLIPKLAYKKLEKGFFKEMRHVFTFL